MNRYRFTGRSRRKAGEMNKTEKSYSDYLFKQKVAGLILDFWYEPFSLKLAGGCFYRPDFMVLLSDLEIEIHEVKGFWEDDALVKIKVAAEKFPFRFRTVKKTKLGFEIREVGVDNLTAKSTKNANA